MWERCDQFAPRPPSRSAGRPRRPAARVGGGDAADARTHLARRRAHPQEQERASLALRPAAATAAFALRQPPLTDGCTRPVRPSAQGRAHDHSVPAQCCCPPVRHPQGRQRCVGVLRTAPVRHPPATRHPAPQCPRPATRRQRPQQTDSARDTPTAVVTSRSLTAGRTALRGPPPGGPARTPAAGPKPVREGSRPCAARPGSGDPPARAVPAAPAARAAVRRAARGR